MIHIDTHVALWLAGDQADRVPAATRVLIEAEDVRLSAVAQLEMGYLHEIGRISRPPAEVMSILAAAVGLTMSTATLPVVVAHALSLTWTRDPFDRLIVANALADGARLVTTDRQIRSHVSQAVWD